ncbi:MULTISPECIES: Bug family tripartite tricarboxylate transporter substrate binding protein [Variovorax]|jgi:tripartite-type tricarboxylate transporter receptor subunit TctC|uniref:Bug family tripartite tricarboxylate transporter substrate binding protein n=1 Tax=Variovorax TaxID=34072 RepID=UPI000F7F186F|nr:MULTISPECIES: tripartite tricarboxylate transporter substrate-binding protein [Variovorax]MDR6523634.1 tripartite-type tricarboxylate transporter receptor subunit TctC [Variovorax paradoxus]RTD88445.1 ABC transporter substrate-binding protein [Variovorax sp. 369]
MEPLFTAAALRRRELLAAGLASVLPLAAHAQAWPSRPVTLVVPFPPGGSVDLIARLYADPLAKALGTPVVIDNRAGAGGSIASAQVARAKPDGYTLVASSQSSHLANPLTQPNPGYDPIKDFASISQLSRSINVLLVNPAVPAKNFKEFVALVKSRPGELNFCSAGPGSMGQLNVELMKSQLQLNATHVPYRGGGPLVTALISNEVQFGLDNLAPFLPLIQSGKLRALAVAAPARVAALPDIPTFAELGHPVLNTTSWIGIAAPARTPPEIVATLHKAVRSVADQPSMAEALQSRGALPPEVQSPEQFTAMMSERLAVYGDLVRRAGIRGE